MMSFSSHGGHDVAVLIGAPEPSQTSLAQGQSRCTAPLAPAGCMDAWRALEVPGSNARQSSSVEQPEPGIRARTPDCPTTMRPCNWTSGACRIPLPPSRLPGLFPPRRTTRRPQRACVRACVRARAWTREQCRPAVRRDAQPGNGTAPLLVSSFPAGKTTEPNNIPSRKARYVLYQKTDQKRPPPIGLCNVQTKYRDCERP